MFSSEGLPNVNALWAGLLVEELCRQRVGLFVVAPGSRSTPLAVAVARAVAEGKTTWLVHADERACAFVALGWARATGRPAAVVTTSGTAVANLLPACVEADAAGVPLLLLTADRPPELRDTGANQTVRQPNTFAPFARWASDVPPPDAAVDPAFVLTTAAHAVARTLHPAGPVHLNLAFREPLGSEPDGTDAEALLAPLARWMASKWPYTTTTVSTEPKPRRIHYFAEHLAPIERGLVILGPTIDDASSEAETLASVLKWPLLADIGASARRGGDDVPPVTAAHYDLALSSASFANAHAPDAVVLIGGRPLSKRLLALVDNARPDPYVVVRSGPERFDPGHVVTERVVADPAEWCLSLAEALPSRPGPAAWLQSWRRSSAAAEAAAVEAIGRDLSEPFVARTVARRAPSLVLAASMPIRDVDMFAAYAQGEYFDVFANRGASGIDGTVATAHGVARGLGGPPAARQVARTASALPARTAVPLEGGQTGRASASGASARPVRGSAEPVVLLIGDLALLHDQTSLMLLRDGPQAGPPVVVVVVNNDGGGIFHFLPVARGAHPLPADVFEAALAAPHGLTFAHAARQMGLAYHAPETADAFEATLTEALAEASASGASALVEVRTDRAENAALHARITRAAAAAVEAQM